MVKLPDQLASGGPRIREWTSTSLATVRAVDQLHTAWLTSRQDGKVPVVEAVGVKEAPGQFGSNYEPILQIRQWIDRPQDLQPDTTVQAQPMRRRTPPSYVTEPTGEPEDFSSFASTFGEE
jgi:hypothetical protein